MSIHFHSLRIKEIRKETPECVSVVFDIPERLKENFRFKQGQSLTMRIGGGNEEVRRTYSICSSPFDNELRVAIKKVSGGQFSTFANDRLKDGDLLEVMEPVGKFYTELDPLHKKKYLAIAAGSGITPVLSLIKTTLAAEPHSHFTLVYGNRNRSSIIFFEELESLKNKYLQRFNFINILSRERTDIPLHYGRINMDKLVELGKLVDYSRMDEAFLCGPEEMIFAAKEFLEQKGLDKKNIHFELFTTPGAKKSEVKGEKRELPAESPKSKITVKLDGRAFDFDLGFSDEAILDAALKQGADLPYACKGGVCCTCKAKLVEGEVEMEVHWGLEDEEIKEGYILTCQSHPKTDKVVVDFDER
ncbi:1,2-phenylacetyl-CoA epoxidase subunit PaaE [Terrimonas pollutisoli]|uniref:1,2-phenylacetyl-CoA epoxidase subunit PaaE n=1 Tax=Terrimonas pollutisoli TaxID=3034147 RepID=UPI0023EC1E4F|nr:1,2-phenylacetyl-CoA epoxidase subunit PaaE [Terrimonas sp. H1YJ31]